MRKAMKNWMLAAVASLAFVACGSDGPTESADSVVEPKFPTKVTEAVEAGEVYTLEIEPNMDWVVKVPTETAAYFQILDGGNLRYEKRGKAGKHEIQIQVAEIEEFDATHTCMVSMTMGGKTETIAELTLYPLDRILRVYVAEVDPNENDFVRDDEYQVVYQGEPSTELALIWPYGTVGYMHYIRVEANFPWTIGGEIPAWLSLPITSDYSGEGEGFRMDSNWAAYPEEDTTGTLLFQDLSGEEAVTVLEFEVSIPGVKEYCEVELAASLLFDVNGYYYNSGEALEGVSAIGSITSMKGAQAWALNLLEDGSCTTQSEWVLLTEDAWDTSEGEGGLQRRAMHVACRANETGAVREAMIVVLPKTKAVASAEALLSEGALKEEYEAYVVSYLTQETVEEAQPTYFNDFDLEAATQAYGKEGKNWPYLDQFQGWMNESGTGAETITYDYNGVSARNNSHSSGNYSDYEGSGVNNLFFGTKAYFTIQNITLESTSMTLTFGGEKYKSNADNHFSTEEFTIRLSGDGENWSSPIAYTAPAGEGRWNVGRADFTLPEGTHHLYVRFDALVESAYRIDDLLLIPSEGGQTVAFDAGPILPEQPKEAVKVTIEEFNAAAEDDTLYELTGTVANVQDETYGNFDLVDKTGTVYIYGLCSPEGETQYWAASGVKEGDTLTVQGTRSSYNGKIQMKNAIYVSHTPASGEEPEPEPEPEPEISYDTTDYAADTVTSTEEMEVVFWYPGNDPEMPGAAEQQATLSRVVSGSLYDKYASYKVPIYWLVYEGGDVVRNMCMMKNLPEYYKLASADDKPWLSFEPGEYATVSMDDSVLKDKEGNAIQATGAVVLYSNALKTRCKYVLVCTFKP